MNHSFATFFIAGHRFGLEITSVQEIVKRLEITPVPLSNPWYTGLINLRGKIVLAIGLGRVLGLPEGTAPMSVILEKEDELFSLQVDSVGDVLDAKSDQEQSVPASLPENLRAFLKQIIQLDQGVVMILDENKILGTAVPGTLESERALS